jgi:leucyl-tRNA synthetase
LLQAQPPCREPQQRQQQQQQQHCLRSSLASHHPRTHHTHAHTTPTHTHHTPRRPQVNGKMRGTVELPKDVDQAGAVAAAMAVANVSKFVEGKEVVKVIFVPGKILNLIVK